MLRVVSHAQVRLLEPVDVVVEGEVRPVRGLRPKSVPAVLCALRAADSTVRAATVAGGPDRALERR